MLYSSCTKLKFHTSARMKIWVVSFSTAWQSHGRVGGWSHCAVKLCSRLFHIYSHVIVCNVQ